MILNVLIKQGLILPYRAQILTREAVKYFGFLPGQDLYNGKPLDYRLVIG